MYGDSKSVCARVGRTHFHFSITSFAGNSAVHLCKSTLLVNIFHMHMPCAGGY